MLTFFTLYVVAMLAVSLFSAFVILLLGKIGIRETVVIKAPKIISQLFDCDFCLSFWVAVVLSVSLSVIFGYLPFVTIPVFSTPITRHLL